MELDYNKLAEDYKKNLETNLRGFEGGPGFLSNWTYDEDESRSIQNIIDLAKEDGIEVLKVLIGDREVVYKSEKAKRITECLQTAADNLGLKSAFRIVAFKKQQITLDYDDFDEGFHKYLIKLEAELFKVSGEYFYFHTLNIDDKNKRNKRIGK